jgi:hypothetical protein
MFQIAKPYRSTIALFLLILFMTFTAGCNYYRVTTHYQEDGDLTEKLNKSLNKENLVLFVKGSQTFLAQSIDFDQRSITAELDSLPIELQWLHDEMALSGTNRFNAKKHGTIVHEVRIYPDQNEPLAPGVISVPIDNVKRIDIYDHDTAKEILSWTAVAAGIFGVFVLIVALTKSSCPYIFAHDGQSFQFEGESYGGAIFKPLERMDYIPLTKIDQTSTIKKVRISNQLQERQYINQVKMIELVTPAGVSALIDQYGNAHTYQKPYSPIKATADEKDFSDQLTSKEEGRFLFDTGQTGNSHIDLEFPNQDRPAKLIINAKGSLWFDYLYGEFSKLFGDYYPNFIDLQHRRDRDDLQQWIHDQDLLLTVYEQTIGGWQMIDRFEMVGPLGEGRDMVMTIPVNKDAQDTRTFRIETGFMLWDLNYAALDYTPNQILEYNTLDPQQVLDQHGNDGVPAILLDDSQYLEQLEIGDFVNIDFETSQHHSTISPHYFLAVKGYYEHVRDFVGGPEWYKLTAFKNPGHFTRFSRQVFQAIPTDFYAVNSETY